MRELFQGRVADPARRRVDDPQQRHFVGGPGEDFEIGQHVADLAAVVERLAADENVADTPAAQFRLEQSGLLVRAEENRNVAGRDAARVNQRRNLLHDRLGLGLFVLEWEETDFAGDRPAGLQSFFVPARVMDDEAVGQFEDGRVGAVIHLQADDFGAGKNLLEFQDVPHFGAAPAVNRLVVVADDAERAMPAARATRRARTGCRWCPGTRRFARGRSGPGGGRGRRENRGRADAVSSKRSSKSTAPAALDAPADSGDRRPPPGNRDRFRRTRSLAPGGRPPFSSG